MGAPKDVAATSGIAQRREGNVFNFAGKATLGELAALFSLSTLHLGVDSTAGHIAVAVGVPTTTLFGSGNCCGWTKEDARHRVAHAAMYCVPCNQMGCNKSGKSDCMDNLTAEAVWLLAEEILGHDRI